MKNENENTFDAREYIQFADGYIDDYIETGADEYIKKGLLVCQVAIASVLADIRDELRKMNEKGDK